MFALVKFPFKGLTLISANPTTSNLESGSFFRCEKCGMLFYQGQQEYLDHLEAHKYELNEEEEEKHSHNLGNILQQIN